VIPKMTTTDTTTMIATNAPVDKVPNDPLSDPDAPATFPSSSPFAALPDDGSPACAVELEKDPHILEVAAAAADETADDPDVLVAVEVES